MSLITVTIIMHREGGLAIPALMSMRDMVLRARNDGLNVEARAVLDRGDDVTRHILATRGKWLDGVLEVSNGDLGLSRNDGVISAKGDFLAFLDGDDLWCDDWLSAAHQAAMVSDQGTSTIWHPEWIYYFYEGDYTSGHSTTTTPNPFGKSYYMRQREWDDPYIDKNVMFINNIWTANTFASRTIFETHPYAAIDRDRGFGVEDWSWNIETVAHEVPHRVVADTVHIIRNKDVGSLGRQNTAEGFSAHLSDAVWPRLGGEATRSG